MKKYLTIGMLAIALGGMLVSCSDDDDWSSLAEAKVQAYEEAFIRNFGQPNSRQDWGFGNQTAKARFITRSADCDGNMWAKEGWNVPAPLTAAQKDKVRRWFQQHQNPQGIAINYRNFFVQDVYKGGTNVPEGCATPEQYTAANGDTFTGSNQMDWLTAGSDNDHINNYNNGQCTTYTNVWDGQSYEYKGDDGQGHHAGDPYTPTGDMEVDFNYAKQHSDEIQLMVNSKTDCFGYTNSRQGKLQYNDKYVIIPGDSIQSWDTSGGTEADVSGMFFVGFDFEADLKHGWNSTTESNGYMVTEVPEGTANAFQVPNEGPYKDKWVIDGAADGYYSDWIVRVVEGIKAGDNTSEATIVVSSSQQRTVRKMIEYYQRGSVVSGRVFCEDLGKADRNDIDFNDVVFDAFIYNVNLSRKVWLSDGEGGWNFDQEFNNESTKKYTKIQVLAAGGTLPLKVAGTEVHGLFGVSTDVIINTAGPMTNLTQGTVTYVDTTNVKEFEAPFYESLNQIPIVVRVNKEVIDLDNPDSLGSVPHKICVPLGTKWAQERIAISPSLSNPNATDVAYPDFLSYVASPSDTPWNNGNDEYLYQWNHIPEVSSEVDECYRTEYKDTLAWVTVEETIPVYMTIATPDETNETVVWSGAWNLKSNLTNQLILEETEFANKGVAEGKKLRIYGVCDETWGLSVRDKTGSDVIVSYISQDSDPSFRQRGYYEVSLNASLANILTTNGMLIDGSRFKVTYITIVDTPAGGGGGNAEQLWPANNGTGEATSEVSISYESFNANMTGKTLKIYGKDFNANTWQILLSLPQRVDNNNNFAGISVNQPWGNNYGALAIYSAGTPTGSVLELPITEQLLAKFMKYGISLSFSNLTVTSVKVE